MSNTLPQEGTVKTICDFYMVLIGLSVGYLVENIAGDFPQRVNTEAILDGVIFMVTLLPFSFGAIKHMHKTYLPNQSGAVAQAPKKGAILLDFAFQLLQGTLFILWATVVGVDKNYLFVWVFVLILGIDVFWSVLVFYIFNAGSAGPELNWMLTNSITSIISTLAVVVITRVNDLNDRHLIVIVVITVLSVLRTFVDISRDITWYTE